MLKRWVVASGILAVVALSAVISAQGQSGSRGRGRGGSGGGTDVQVSVAVIFRDTDQATFRSYFATHKITAQPLPPGIAKNVARGKPLPPGIAKRTLPGGLLAVGPKVGSDVSFAIIGDVVVALRSGVVIDVLAGVFR